jgi:hypothetical protein
LLSPPFADFSRPDLRLLSWKSSVEFQMPASRPETFEPEVLALLGSIYDETWSCVAAGYTQADPKTREEARAELAAIMLRLAEEKLGSNELKDKALRLFRRASSPAAVEPAGLQASLQD